MRPTVGDTTAAGIWLTSLTDAGTPAAEVPVCDLPYAAAIVVNGVYFTIDASGNVRGDPEAVEREALTQNINGNLVARAAVGLARLALRSRR